MAFLEKLKTWLVELAGLVLAVAAAAGRGLLAIGRWLRPYAMPLRDRVAGVWTATMGWGRRFLGTWGSRLRRPAIVTLRAGLFGSLLAGLTLALGNAFVRQTPAGQIAVRQVEWGGAGVVERDHGPGLQRDTLGRDTWHLLPAGTHIISFASQADGGTQEPLEVATLEGEACQVSVFVPYRILPGSGWRLVSEGLRADYPARALAICRRVLLEELGALSAAEFSDPDARARVAQAARARLVDELGATHLEPLDVRVGNVFFAPTYEKKMLEKQLSAQNELTVASLERRKEQERAKEKQLHILQDAELDLIQGYALQEEALRDAHESELHLIGRGASQYRAEALSSSKVEALLLANEGELALAAAEDLGRTLLDEALRSAGGRLHLAKEAAENLRFGKVTLNSNDPRVPSVIDLDELVALLMGSGE